MKTMTRVQRGAGRTGATPLRLSPGEPRRLWVAIFRGIEIPLRPARPPHRPRGCLKALHRRTVRPRSSPRLQPVRLLRKSLATTEVRSTWPWA